MVSSWCPLRQCLGDMVLRVEEDEQEVGVRLPLGWVFRRKRGKEGRERGQEGTVQQYVGWG